jgi:hypothetical protein
MHVSHVCVEALWRREGVVVECNETSIQLAEAVQFENHRKLWYYANKQDYNHI